MLMSGNVDAKHMLLEDTKITLSTCIGDLQGHSMLVIYLANIRRSHWTALADSCAAPKFAADVRPYPSTWYCYQQQVSREVREAPGMILGCLVDTDV
jgi:hypothetical protein